MAVLDGPVDVSHPSLVGAQLRVINGLRGSACRDAACVHGTHVASLIFGQHGVGLLHGVAPRCRGIVIPVFFDDPAYPGAILPCSQADLARAIEAAVGYGARVINISAGQPGHADTADPRLVRAVDLCARRGVLIVAAAGNDGCDCLHLPASLPSVLTVGAYQPGGAPSDSSNFGSAYQRQGIVAPGLSVLGATPGGGYARRSGTSFAAPLVAGLAGLLLSARLARGVRFTARDAREIHDALLRSATPCDLDNRNDCRRLLAGRVDPVNAFHLFLKGASHMQQLANPPISQAQDPSEVIGIPDGVIPASASAPGGSCGCNSPASGEDDPDPNSEEQARPSG
ncbi:MAG: S8 family serine peptidase, partial [Bryobacteraceae bacterium]|nr:S8 family serine peptidase [Bryobacteraceae bacterium]